MFKRKYVDWDGVRPLGFIGFLLFFLGSAVGAESNIKLFKVLFSWQVAPLKWLGNVILFTATAVGSWIGNLVVVVQKIGPFLEVLGIWFFPVTISLAGLYMLCMVAIEILTDGKVSGFRPKIKSGLPKTWE